MRTLILSLDKSGQPNSWLPWQQAVTLKSRGIVSYEIGEKTFVFWGGRCKVTGDRTMIEMSSIIVLKTPSVFRNRIPTLTNENLFLRDLFLCAYCGKTFRATELTRDHIIPKSRNGKNTWTNCVTACRRCNSMKNDMTPEECNMMLRYVPYVPDKAEGLILHNRNILADQMAFLKNFLPKHSRQL